MSMGFHKNGVITYISIYDTGYKSMRFVFDWSQKHWFEHYNELAYIPNEYYYELDKWDAILNIASGKDPITYALLYMSDDNEHIRFIAKLMLIYGRESVKFKFENDS